jgi:mono/diheme cytochrome c family protein
VPARMSVRRRRRRGSLGVVLSTTALIVCVSGCSPDHQVAPAQTPARARNAVANSAATQPSTPHRATPLPTPSMPPAAIASPTDTPLQPSRVDLASGKLLVQAQCAACHALAGAGISSAAQPVAPALDGIGARHSRAWIDATLANACGRSGPTAASGCRQAHAIIAALTPLQRNQVAEYLLSLH